MAGELLLTKELINRKEVVSKLANSKGCVFLYILLKINSIRLKSCFSPFPFLYFGKKKFSIFLIYPALD